MPETNHVQQTISRRKQIRPQRHHARAAAPEEPPGATDDRTVVYDNFFCMGVPEKRPPRYAGWLPLIGRRSKVRGLDVTDNTELLRFNEDNPYVASIVAEQFCACTEEAVQSDGFCCPPKCCKSRHDHDADGKLVPLAAYRIAVIYKNEFHRYRAHDCCTAKYVRCINETHGTTFPYAEWQFELNEGSVAPHVLLENEPCVDLRYLVFEE
jgi:hypothetical protein